MGFGVMRSMGTPVFQPFQPLLTLQAFLGFLSVFFKFRHISC